jgi:hypothetical protein
MKMFGPSILNSSSSSVLSPIPTLSRETPSDASARNDAGGFVAKSQGQEKATISPPSSDELAGAPVTSPPLPRSSRSAEAVIIAHAQETAERQAPPAPKDNAEARFQSMIDALAVVGAPPRQDDHATAATSPEERVRSDAGMQPGTRADGNTHSRDGVDRYL